MGSLLTFVISRKIAKNSISMDTSVHAVQHETDLWLARAKAWQEKSEDLDTVLEQTHHLSHLVEYLRRLHKRLRLCLSIPDALHTFPQVGQLLGRLTILPRLLLDDSVYTALIACVMYFYVDKPSCPVEIRSKAWVMSQLHTLVAQIHGASKDELICSVSGHTVHDYHKACSQVIVSSYVDRPEVSESTGCCRKSSDLPSCTPDLGALTALCTVCMSVRHHAMYHPVWCRALSTLLTNHCGTPQADSVLQQLVLSQQHPYTTPEPVFALPYQIQLLVWTTSQDALEHEVLDLVETVTGKSEQDGWRQRVLDRHLICACTASCAVYHLVFDVLRTITEQTSGRWDLVALIGWLYSHITKAAVEQGISTSQFHHPEKYRSLVCLLSVEPKGLTWESLSRHIVELCHSTQSLLLDQVPEVEADVCFILVQHIHWYKEILTHVYTCHRQTVDSCIHVMLMLHSHSLISYDVLLDVVLSLRGLYSKTSVCVADLQCALAGVLDDPHALNDPSACDGPRLHHPMLVHLLLVFGLMSASGIKLIGEILKVVSGFGLSDNQTLTILIETLELVGDTKGMSADKIKQVCGHVSQLMDNMSDSFRLSGLFKWFKARLKHLY